jgi:hypothetical protein
LSGPELGVAVGYSNFAVGESYGFGCVALGSSGSKTVWHQTSCAKSAKIQAFIVEFSCDESALWLKEGYGCIRMLFSRTNSALLPMLL